MIRRWPLSLLALAACATEPIATRPSASSSASTASDRGDMRSRLSGEALEAYDVLARTRRFTTDAIYEGAQTPREVIALRILGREPDAAAIFRDLFETDSMGTRLYALCGLYYADPPAFDAAVGRLRGTHETIEFQVGCERMMDCPVASLLDGGERPSLGYDIVGGGFPDLFRSGSEYRRAREQRLEEGVD